ncbi:hypothetical protein REA19_08340 [Prescottella equi]|nr:hypothetical protein REA19_08340 [Prescottella equi]
MIVLSSATSDVASISDSRIGPRSDRSPTDALEAVSVAITLPPIDSQVRNKANDLRPVPIPVRFHPPAYPGAPPTPAPPPSRFAHLSRIRGPNSRDKCAKRERGEGS